jgi:GTPase-activator protein for Ras-like GTPase
MGYTIAMAAREADGDFAPLVAGFILLRVVNPAFVDPAAYGLLPKGVKEVGSAARQNLISVSRILQKLANNTLFTREDEFYWFVPPAWLCFAFSLPLFLCVCVCVCVCVFL